MSVKQVTEHLLCSPSKVSRIETGQRDATLRDVRDLCDLYGVTAEAERDHLMALAREAKQPGWWQSYDLPYSTYVGLRGGGAFIKDYDSAVIPGLLQTPEYVRGLYSDPMPEPSVGDLTPEIVDKRVEERLRRQRVLTREEPSPLTFWVILDEAVLHRVVGGTAVMGAQLRRVVQEMRRPNITVQVLPYSVGAHPALNSTFNILEFSGLAPDIVYSEGLSGRIFIDRPEDVRRYKEVFDHLCEIALAPDRSAELMMRISKVYENALRVAG